jgi:hypothetical protein
VPLHVILDTLDAGGCQIVDLNEEHTAFRHLVTARLGERTRSSPRPHAPRTCR